MDPANPEGVQLPADASNTKHVLVQLNREMDTATMSALESHHAEIVKRMVGDTWLLYYPPDDLRALETIDSVEHALVYVNEFVVHSDLKNSQSSDTTQEFVPVSVYLHENARSSADSALREIQGVASNARVAASHDGVFHLEVSRDDLQRIAHLDSVQAIEEVPEAVPYNDRIREVSGINRFNSSLHSAGESILTGADQCVGIADTGVDTSHEAFKSKVAKTWYVNGEENDDDGHGTHVAGTILGAPVKGWEGHDVTGMAPSARLSVQGGIFRSKNLLATELFDQAYSTPGATCRIHNNSWGFSIDLSSPVQAPYTTADAERVDEWALAHPDFLIVYAAGNDGLERTPTGAQVGAWGVAKNVLTVGATFTDRPYRDDFAADYSIVTPQTKRGKVTSFSSRGPVIKTLRTKPDVVAPGVGILSSRATHPSAVREQAKWPAKFGQPLGGFKPGDKTIFCSGTSMAAPAVSGYAALLREALVKWQNVSSPLAPLMKALIINGTDDLQLDKTIQGYGEVNMSKVLSPVQQKVADIDAGKASSGHAQGTAVKGDVTTKSFKTIVPKASSTGKSVNLQVTFVYHDLQGAEIQNRMSLLVEQNGNKVDTEQSHKRENVHRVLMNNLTAGDVVKIQVVPKLLLRNAPWGVVWNHFEA